MIAITLAAGLGSRMGELCKTTHKTMLSFLGDSLLSRQQQLFTHHHIPHYVVTGHQAETIRHQKDKLIANDDYLHTNMVYSLWCARSLFEEMSHRSEDIIISYGDIIYQQDVLEKLMSTTGGDIQLCADQSFFSLWSERMAEPLSDLETFKTDTNTGFITEIGTKAQTLDNIEAQYIGLFKISSHFLMKFIHYFEELMRKEPHAKSIAMTDFMQHLIATHQAQIRPAYISGGWLEFDSIQDYESYQNLQREGQLRRFYAE